MGLGLDHPERVVMVSTQGDPNIGIRHEQWPCGTKAGRTNKCEFCTFIMHKETKPPTVAVDV